jgi:hypothetical protein
MQLLDRKVTNPDFPVIRPRSIGHSYSQQIEQAGKNSFHRCTGNGAWRARRTARSASCPAQSRTAPAGRRSRCWPAAGPRSPAPRRIADAAGQRDRQADRRRRADRRRKPVLHQVRNGTVSVPPPMPTQLETRPITPPASVIPACPASGARRRLEAEQHLRRGVEQETRVKKIFKPASGSLAAARPPTSVPIRMPGACGAPSANPPRHARDARAGWTRGRA